MSASSPSAYLRLPAQLGPYELTERLGAGGMGVVYRGRAPGGAEVAVKLIREQLTTEEETQRRFLREARAAARLEHPNIAQLWDFGRADGHNFLVMELVEGDQLSVWRKQPPDGRHLLPVAFQILDALAYAHARGVVHRDLKPENIMIRCEPGAPPQVKLMDFGVAHLRHGSPDEETPDEAGFVGTPAYMSPEQARRSNAVAPSADLYSLGILLFELLAGHLPFRERSVAATLLAQIHNAPPPLLLRPGYVAAGPLVETVERLLRKRPAERYMFAADVAAALARCSLHGEAGTPAEVQPLPPPKPVVPPPANPEPEPASDEEEIYFTLQVSHFGTFAGSEPSVQTVAPIAEEPGPRRDPPALPSPIAAIFARAWQEPMPDLPLLASEPSSSVASLRESALVGRVGELARIKTLAAAACRKQRGAACLLLGADGMGKTRLLRAAQEALEQSGAMQVWSLERSRSEASGREALLQTVTAALGLHAAPPEDWPEQLCALFPERDRHAWNATQLADLLRGATGDGPAFDESEEFRLIGWTLRKAAAHRPVCLAVDDLHLRDGYLPRLLTYLLREQRDSGAWFLLGALDHERLPGLDAAVWTTMLQTYPSRGLLDLVRLQPLTFDASLQWAQSALPGQPAFAELVAERGAGNPRFIASLIRHRVERAGVAANDETLPDELAQILAQRVERLEAAGQLSPESIALGTFAAVAGEPLPFELLVTDDRATRYLRARDALSLAEALQELLDCRLLVETEADLFRFDAPAVRALFLKRGEADSAALHRRAAAAKQSYFGSDQPTRAAEVGAHLLAAGECTSAVPYLLLAARHQARCRNFERVRALAATASDTIERATDADAETREVWSVTANSLLLEALVQTGEHSAARELGKRLVPRTGDGTELQRRALRTLAESALQSSSPREARTLLTLCLASAERAGDEEGIVHILLSLGNLELHESRLDAARDCLARAIVKAQHFESLLPRVLLEAARAARLAEDWDEVDAAAGEAERRARAQGDPIATAAAQALLAERELALGALHRAEALLNAAGDAFAATGSRQHSAGLLPFRAHLELARGNRAEAFLLHARAEEAFAAIGNRSAAAIAQAEKALLAAEEENWTLAGSLAAAALRADAEQRIDHHRFVRVMAELALRALDTGQEALAAALLMPTYHKLQRIGVLPVLHPVTEAISRRVAAAGGTAR